MAIIDSLAQHIRGRCQIPRTKRNRVVEREREKMPGRGERAGFRLGPADVRHERALTWGHSSPLALFGSSVQTTRLRTADVQPQRDRTLRF